MVGHLLLSPVLHLDDLLLHMSNFIVEFTTWSRSSSSAPSTITSLQSDHNADLPTQCRLGIFLQSLAGLAVAGLAILIGGCASLSAPPARPLEQGEAVVGARLSGPWPSGGVQSSFGLGGGDIYTHASFGFDGTAIRGNVAYGFPRVAAGIATEAGAGGRFYLSPERRLSQALRKRVALGLEASAATVDGDPGRPIGHTGEFYGTVGNQPSPHRGTNGTMRWAEVSGRAWALADPDGAFGSLFVTGRLESQHPNRAVLKNPPSYYGGEGETGEYRFETARDRARQQTFRLFLGGTLGHRYQLSSEMGLQFRTGLEVDLLGRRPSGNYVISFGLQVDGTLARF